MSRVIAEGADLFVTAGARRRWGWGICIADPGQVKPEELKTEIYLPVE